MTRPQRYVFLQVVFEDFGLPSYLPISSAELCMRAFAVQQPDIPANAALCGLLIDCGFSATHAVPIFDGNVLLHGVKRINVGGKALTNYLKELVSFRFLSFSSTDLLGWPMPWQLTAQGHDLHMCTSCYRGGGGFRMLDITPKMQSTVMSSVLLIRRPLYWNLYLLRWD